MNKDSVLSIRLSSEHKRRLIKAAHDSGQSVAELFLFSVDSRITKHYIDMAKKFDELKESLPAGELRDKIAAAEIAVIERAEWFQNSADAVKDSSDAYKEIESLETYRDLLRETVATE